VRTRAERYSIGCPAVSAPFRPRASRAAVQRSRVGDSPPQASMIALAALPTGSKQLGRPRLADNIENRIWKALATPGRPGVRKIAEQFEVGLALCSASALRWLALSPRQAPHPRSCEAQITQRIRLHRRRYLSVGYAAQQEDRDRTEGYQATILARRNPLGPLPLHWRCPGAQREGGRGRGTRQHRMILRSAGQRGALRQGEGLRSP
jgi:hypothetical protein